MNQKIEEVLHEAERECLEAVEYVGRANYNEREHEAIIKVEETFSKLHQLFQPQIEQAVKAERERILNYLKGLLADTPKASLAATVDLIETQKKYQPIEYRSGGGK